MHLFNPKAQMLRNFKIFSIDGTQAISYLFAIIFTSYGYCILRLESSNLDFNNIDDPIFNEQNDANVETLLSAEGLLTEDDKGIKL